MDDTGDSNSNISRRRHLAKRTSSDKYEARRAEIISTAAKVFRERGFGDTSIQDIADALGVNRATLYYYTSGRKELYYEVVGSAVEANVQAIESIRDSGQPADDKIREAISSLMDSYEQNYPYLYVWVQEDMSHMREQDQSTSHGLSGLARRYQQALDQIVREGVDSGALRGFTNPDVVALGILGMVNWTHRWFRPETMSAAEVSKTFADVLLSGLLPRPGVARSPNAGLLDGESKASLVTDASQDFLADSAD